MNVVCVCRYNDVCMCVRTRGSAFSWCLKSSMMHEYRIGSLLDAVSLSVNDRVNCRPNVCMTIVSFEEPLSIPFIARGKF